MIGSLVFIDLLPYATPEVLESFLAAVCEDLRLVCTDKFASKLLQNLIEVTADRATRHLQDNDKMSKLDIEIYADEHIQKCHDFTIKISEFMINNMEDLVSNEYGNYVLQTCIIILSGGVKSEASNRGNKNVRCYEITKIFKIVPSDWKSLVVEFAKRLTLWSQFKELPYKVNISSLLQLVISSLTNCDIVFQQQFVHQIVTHSFAPETCDKTEESENSNKVLPVFESYLAIKTLVVCIDVALPELFSIIYKTCFYKNLRQLSLVQLSKIAVVTLINNCDDNEMFEAIFSELEESFATLSERKGYSGVLLSIARTCRRLVTQQGQFINIICKILNWTDSKSSPDTKIAPLTVYDLTSEIEEMLNFNEPIKIVNGLLAMHWSDLLKLFCDQKGRYVAFAFFNSQFIGRNSRDSMCTCLKGTYPNLAFSKFGSGVLQCIWKHVDCPLRSKILDELVAHTDQLNNTVPGRIICNKFKVALYKRSPSDWEQSIQNENKIKDEIIGESH